MPTLNATITINMRAVDRIKTVQAVMDRMLRVGQAAQRLGLSRQQMRRLVERYTSEGPAGLVFAQAWAAEQSSTRIWRR